VKRSKGFQREARRASRKSSAKRSRNELQGT
jgi:hypothetical protein